MDGYRCCHAKHSIGCTRSGLGACSIGSFNQEAVARLLQLPDNLKLALFITIGVPERVPETPKKRSLQEISFTEKYGGSNGQ